MNVTFVSHSDKKAVKTVCGILDNYVTRIDSNVWNGTLTQDCLNAIHKQLRNHATKSMSVVCYKYHRKFTELAWIVGNSHKLFEGAYPVATTDHSIPSSSQGWELYEPVCVILELAAIFHDIGKISDGFQQQVRGFDCQDQYRHEWLSIKILEALVTEYKLTTNKQFFDFLIDWANGEQSIPTNINDVIVNNIDSVNVKNVKNISVLFAAMIIILSHHRKPSFAKGDKGKYEKLPYEDFDNEYINMFRADFGYKREYGVMPNLSYSVFPDDTEEKIFRETVKRIAENAKQYIEELETLCSDKYSFDLIVFAGIKILKVTDYNVSKMPANSNNKSSFLAKSSTKEFPIPQKVDEHCCLAAGHIKEVMRAVEYYNNHVECPIMNTLMVYKATGKYDWQNSLIRVIKKNTKEGKPIHYFISMFACTGSGKTNAIFKCIKSMGKEMRLTITSGRRILSLQSYNKCKKWLTKNSYALVLGDSSISELYKNNNEEEVQAHMDVVSDETTIDEAVEKVLNILCDNDKDELLLYKPIIFCTIDFMMRACESIRGQKELVASFRLKDSCVVIDEIDNFDIQDIPALCRFAKIVGMAGAHLIIASATLNEMQTRWMFNNWVEGIKSYESVYHTGAEIHCVFCNEFETVDGTIDMLGGFLDRQIAHRSAMKKYWLKIIKCDDFPMNQWDGINVQHAYFNEMLEGCKSMHNQYYSVDSRTEKHISFGLIRFANTTPCVNCFRFLNNLNGKDYDVFAVPNHSRIPRARLYELDEWLAHVLDRNSNNWENDPYIRDCLDKSTKRNVLFIVVATPRIETGCDYDFDYCVCEFSSMSSLVQLTGRVHRHRDIAVVSPNIMIMQYNVCTMEYGTDAIAFRHPGYETKDKISKAEYLRMSTHDACKLFQEGYIDAQLARLPRAKEHLQYKTDAIDLEHMCWELRDSDMHRLKDISGFNNCALHTGFQQIITPFRDGRENVDVGFLRDNGKYRLYTMHDSEPLEPLSNVRSVEMVSCNNERLLFNKSFHECLCDIAHTDNEEILYNNSKKFGIISVPKDWIESEKDIHLCFNENLGMWREYSLSFDYY